MVAHKTISVGIAELFVELGRALEVGEHDGNTADLGIVPGAQELLWAEPSERRHGYHALTGQRVRGPGSVFDDKEQGAAGLVANEKLLPPARWPNNDA